MVWSRTLELLDGLGLAASFVQSGMKANAVSIYGEGQRLVHVEVAGVESPFPFPLMIPQSETERLLGEHLLRQGVPVERRVELLSFSERADAISCTLRHADSREESFETPWLLGCDAPTARCGTRSASRSPVRLSQTIWFLADVHLEGSLPADEVSVFWHKKGALVFFPISAGRFRVIADLGAAEAASRPDPTLADVQAKVDERGARRADLERPGVAGQLPDQRAEGV